MKHSQLSIRDLSFERNNQTLFRAVNFTLSTGEMLQVRGANGSGKSSLLRILAGYMRPELGDVCWDGQCIFKNRDEYQQQLHYLGHQNGIKPLLTARENLTLNSALLLKKNTSGIKNILARLGLERLQDTKAMHFSAGQSRRLALARLLLHPLRLWILDEPATALDAEGQALLAAMLAEHLQNNGSAIIATHQDLGAKTQTLNLGEKHA
jgi:heme exporter protein A